MGNILTKSDLDAIHDWPVYTDPGVALDPKNAKVIAVGDFASGRIRRIVPQPVDGFDPSNVIYLD